VHKKPFMAPRQNTSQYSSFRSKLWGEKLEIEHIESWQNCRDVAVKAGLEKNKIGRWEKFRGGNCRNNDLESFVQNFIIR
jgi:hypothetical protein